MAELTPEEKKGLIQELMEHPGWEVVLGIIGSELKTTRNNLWNTGPNAVLDQQVASLVGGVGAIRNVVTRFYGTADTPIPENVKHLID